MIERHQDYILTVATVPPGGLRQLSIRLDSDAPFALRLVRSRNIGLNGWRFTTPRGAYQSNALRTDWIVPVQAGQPPYPSRGSLIWEEMIYPANGVITVDIGNATGENLTNAQLLFRGSKLYQDGAMSAPTYPQRMGVLPAVYQVVVPQVGLNAFIPNNVLKIKSDADFVYRYGACDAYTLSAGAPAADYQYTNVYVTLRDEAFKAYSNAGIHVNDLFGQGLPIALGGNNQDDQVLFTPGLITPEIYIPKNHAMYFDVQRSDSSGNPVDLYFRFGGMKVFER